MTPAELRQVLAEATVPCPDHYAGWLAGASKEVSLKPGELCRHCGEVDQQGRVYFFPDDTGVRVPCPENFHWGPCPGVGQPLNGSCCPVCGFPMRKVPKNGKMGRHSGRLPDHTGGCLCQGRGRTAAEDGWEEAAVGAGASLFRTWWDRQQEQWMAEVRLVAVHLPSSVAAGNTPEEARLTALLRAVEAREGVELRTAL